MLGWWACMGLPGGYRVPVMQDKVGTEEARGPIERGNLQVLILYTSLLCQDHSESHPLSFV